MFTRLNLRRHVRTESLESRLLFAVFPVTTTADSGAGSLRQAILDANAAVGLDSIEFGIGTGAQTITPLTPLPAISDTAGTVITGASQTGFAAGTPVITIDGSSAGSGSAGLDITGGNTTVIGLIVRNFGANQIQTSGATGHNSIVGNVVIGDNNTANGAFGISIGSANDRVGGPGVGGRNVVSGQLSAAIVIGQNSDDAIVENNRVGTNAAGTAASTDALTGTGIFIDRAADAIVINNVASAAGGSGIATDTADGILIQGNFVGTNATGAAALGNGDDGIQLNNTQDAMVLNNVASASLGDGITLGPGSHNVRIEGNKIGTNLAGDTPIGNAQSGIDIGGANAPVIVNNVISGNGGDGIEFTDGSANPVIQNNRIGTDNAGTADLGNAGDGIQLGPVAGSAVTGATVGGTTAGQGNIIAFNSRNGVFIPAGHSGHSILGNSIFSNDLLGIDLDPPTGRTPNDPGDADTGGNALQNFPVISQATAITGTPTISGTLSSTPSTAFRIEFFSDTSTPAASVEGRTLLGSTTVTTNSSGIASFNTTVSGIITGRSITATATNNVTGNTSEFSDPVFGGTGGPDIAVRGNSVEISTGDATPSVADFTDFGPLQVGDLAGVSRVFTLINNGSSTLDLSLTGNSPVSVSGPGAAQFTVIDQPQTSLIAGSSSTFEIRFVPSAAGNQQATVSIVSNDPDENPFTFTIAGQGTTPTPAPEIELLGNGNAIPSGDTEAGTADNTDFSTAAIGAATPVSRTFTIANAGQVALTVGTVSLTGANANQFAIGQQPEATVAPGQSTAFTVQFVPTLTNQLTATVSIPNNDSDENPYTFAVRGVAIPGPGDPPTASVLPQDQQPIAQLNSATYDFLVRYADEDAVSSTSLGDTDLVVTGPNGFSQAAQFVQVQTPGTTQLDARYRITAPGGTLDAADDGTYTVTIQANEVSDVTGNTVVAGAIGSFTLDLASARQAIGSFGRVGNRNVKLVYMDDDSTTITFSLSNGTAQAFRTADGRIDLDVSSTAGKLTITTRGGNGRAELNDIHVAGSLKSLVGKTGDITGVLIGAGAVSAVTLGSATGATISTPAPISSINILGNMASTQIFSGAILGTDGRFGGTGAAADTAFGAGSINKFNVNGSITQSLIAAGLDPVDDVLLNGNGMIVGGVASRIGSIRVNGNVDQATVFAAGAFPKKARIGGSVVVPTSDPRFDMTP